MANLNVNPIILGLDLGLNNIGFAVLAPNNDNLAIQEMGTYVFESPMVDVNNPKDGYKSAQRGQFRRQRRTTQRRAERKQAVYQLLAQNGLLPTNRKERVELLCQQKYKGQPDNPYILRSKALTEPLTPFQLGKVIAHLSNHRAFLSPRAQRLIGVGENLLRNSTTDDKETQGFLKQISQTQQKLQELGFQTVGQLYAQRIQNNELVRLKTKTNRKTGNKKRTKDQRTTLKPIEVFRADRFMIRDELNLILDQQQKHHPLITPDFRKQIETAIFNQRPIEQFTKRGKCSFYNDHLRIYRASLPAQKYEIAQLIAHLTVTLPPNQPRTLTPEERALLVNHLMTGENLSWTKAKELLQLPKTAKFNREPAGEKSQSGTLKQLPGSKTIEKIKAIIPEKWLQLNYQEQAELVGDLIGSGDSKTFLLLKQKKWQSNNHRIFELLKKKTFASNQITFTEQEAAQLVTLELPKGTLSVSLKFIKKVTPHLLKDKNYSEACTAVGLDHAQPDRDLGKIHRLTNDMAEHILHPGVRCSVQNAFRLINAVLDKYLDLKIIHIELPRDIALNEEQKREREKAINENAEANFQIKKRLREAGLPTTGDNILRVKLFDETGGQLPYEPGTPPIPSIKEACSPDYEIDHIVPRSVNLQNNLGNLVLASTNVNRVKANQTPHQAFSKDQELWQKIKVHVMDLKGMNLRKRQRILSAEPPQGFVEAQLTATGYISREILTAIKRLDRELDVVVMPGRITGFLRKEWQLEGLIPLHPVEKELIAANKALEEKGEKTKNFGKFRSNYKHHALDALVVALTSRSMLQKVTAYYKDYEQNPFGEHKFPMPVTNMREAVKASIPHIQIIHKPNRKDTGQLHDQTARTPPPGTPKGKPYQSKRIGNKLFRYDHEGNPFAYYELGNNHHVSFFQNGKDIVAHVATLMEVYDRRRAHLPTTVREHPQFPNATYIGSLRKNDMVRMQDGTFGYVSKFSQYGKIVDMWIWNRFAASQIGKGKDGDPYLISRITGQSALKQIYSRVVFSPLGELFKEEILFPKEE
jgi:CRISPR-associated endonuclease Csn1